MGQKRDVLCEHRNVFKKPESAEKTRKPMQRGEQKRKPRKAMSRKQPKRDWLEARTKVELEGACRKCRVEYAHLEAAHIVGRKHDAPRDADSKTLWVNPDRIVPLCPTCHQRYDAHGLDLLGHLSLEEQIQAVRDCEGIEIARRRIAPSAYREVFA